ncbi:unnamed protein product, partial [Ixodes pacificus]
MWCCADLQLAAELGKTLLERNQELEDTVRQQQVLIEEQAQELQVSALARARVSDGVCRVAVESCMCIFLHEPKLVAKRT